MGGLGEKAKTFIHSIDSLDAEKGVSDGSGQAATTDLIGLYDVKNRRQYYSGIITTGSHGWGPVPKDTVWLIINCVATNDSRPCVGFFSMLNNKWPKTMLYNYECTAAQTNYLVDILGTIPRPLIGCEGDQFSFVDRAAQAGDKDAVYMTYYEVKR